MLTAGLLVLTGVWMIVAIAALVMTSVDDAALFSSAIVVLTVAAIAIAGGVYGRSRARTPYW